MTDSAKAVVQRFIDDVANGRDLQRIDELLSDDFSLPIGEGHVDRDGLRAILTYYFAAFPDLHYEVKLLIGDGDHAPPTSS
jgi:predicted ester cyclase